MVTLLAQATLAPPTSTHDFNANFFGWLIVAALLVLAVLVQLKSLKRKPSVDTDMATLQASIQALTHTLKSTNDNLKSHEKDLAELREKITVKLPVLDEVNRRLSEIEDGGTRRDEIMAKLREKQTGNSENINSIKTDVHEIRTMILGIIGRTAKH